MFQSSKNSINGQLTGNSATANDTGAGFGDAASLSITVSKMNNEIVTTILVDIQGLKGANGVKDVIGDDGEANAYMTKITSPVNGFIYRVTMACIEQPNGNVKDIDLTANTTAQTHGADYDSSGAGIAVITAGGNWNRGSFEGSANGPAGTALADGLHDHYLMLSAGAGGGGTSDYSAGQFVIKLYGATI